MLYANLTELAFHTTSDSMDGAGMRRTFPFPLIKLSSYTITDTGKGKEVVDFKEDWMLADMMRFR